MRIVQVVTSVSAEASGPSYTVPSLSRALGRAGHEVELLSVLGPALDTAAGFSHRVFQRARWPARLCRSPQLFDALARAALAADVLHSHGLWMLPNVYPGWVRRAPGAPLVISPRGTLSSWALGHSRWRKRAAWALAQGRVVRAATCLHATAEDEYHDLRRLGLRQPVCVIPNGVDIPPEPGERVASDGPRTILYLGRLHIKKGIDRLLRAWAALAPSRPDWCVSIVGPDDGGHATELRALARGLGVPRVTFAGPVYGAEKQALYQRAALHVLPSHSENFGMTVAEALASGTPVISTRGTPWSGLEREGCGFWIEHGVEPLTVALSAATAMPRDALAALGARGRAWMRRDYSWDGVGRQMADVYHWLSGGGAAPASIRLD
jgi:glycosyltransferase involved in cell wall biosynthesis